jgi:hypothetical protein
LLGIRPLPVIAALSLAGCALGPETYPLPAQRPQGFQAWELEPPFVEMKASNAAEYVVRDISPTPEGATWTFDHPELRFLLNSTSGLRFVADFGVPPVTMEQTGPVTISVRINGHPLGRIRCPAPGDRRFEKPVPPEWLDTTSYTRVEMEADKHFISPRDGVRLGFILHRAGFVE